MVRRSWGSWAVVVLLVPVMLFMPMEALSAGFQGSSTATTGGGPATTLPIATPVSVGENDLLIAVLAVRGGTGVTITPPTGWVAGDRINLGTDLAHAVFLRVATASEPASYTWSFSVSTRASGILLAYRDVDVTGGPLGAVHASSWNADFGTTATAPSVDVTRENARVIAVFSGPHAGLSFTTPDGMQSRTGSIASGAGPNGATIAAFDTFQSAPGSTGAKASSTGQSTDNIGHTLVIVQAGTSSFEVAADPVTADGQPDVDARWGGWDANPGAFDIDSNFLQIRNTGTLNLTSFTVDYSQAAFTGTMDPSWNVGINDNIAFACAETLSDQPPNQLPFTFGPPSSSGSVTCSFSTGSANGVGVIYVQYRLLAIPEVVLAQPYEASFTVT